MDPSQATLQPSATSCCSNPTCCLRRIPSQTHSHPPTPHTPLHPPGPLLSQERNDIIGLVLSVLLTAAGAGLTGFFGDKVGPSHREASRLFDDAFAP